MRNKCYAHKGLHIKNVSRDNLDESTSSALSILIKKMRYLGNSERKNKSQIDFLKGLHSLLKSVKLNFTGYIYYILLNINNENLNTNNTRT